MLLGIDTPKYGNDSVAQINGKWCFRCSIECCGTEMFKATDLKALTLRPEIVPKS